MFYGCSLTSFSVNLSKLTNGRYMFYNCPLTSFSSDISSLIRNGYKMFAGCKLDRASVEHIATALPTYQPPTKKSEDLGNSNVITIHVDTTMSDGDKNAVRAAFTTISGKGWSVDSNI